MIGCLILSGCVNTNPNIDLGPDIDLADDSAVTQEGIRDIVSANNDFAFKFYNRYRNNNANVFFSPYSISSSATMVYEGARGKTADEMRTVFGFSDDDLMRRSASARVFNILNSDDKEYELHTANALWVEQKYTFLPEYRDIISKYYGGRTVNLDFVNKTEESRLFINDWVEDQTENKITNLLSEGSIDFETKMVLTNAIYFKGKWDKKFDTDYTLSEDFKLADGTKVKTDMMKMFDESFMYYEDDSMQVLDMLYKGKDLSMLVFLPKTDLKSILDLDQTKLIQIRQNMRNEVVDIVFPKFKFKTGYSLAQDLKEMGMPLAFTCPVADFSGMDGTTNLCVSSVVHKAFVEVDEEGTEAAAATGWSMKVTSAEPAVPKKFIANHPFVFLIQENSTGEILFMGKLINPVI